MYIHEHDNWPHFRWDNDKIAIALDKACRALGMLYGRLSNLGFDDKLRAIAENLTLDVVQSSEIEGIHLNSEDVRSSIARRLGIDSIKQNDSSSHYIQRLRWAATAPMRSISCRDILGASVFTILLPHPNE